MYNNELLYIDGKWIITSIKLKSFFQLGFSALCIEPTLDQSESEWITMNCLWGAINVMSIMRSDWINDRASSSKSYIYHRLKDHYDYKNASELNS